MNSLIYLDTTLVTRKNSNSKNIDNYYINGKYLQELNVENIQITNKESGEDFLYGLSSFQTTEEVDIFNNLFKEYNEFILNKGGDIESKVDLLCDKISEANNLIHSKVAKNAKKSSISQASILLSQGKFSTVNSNNYTIYYQRDGVLRKTKDKKINTKNKHDNLKIDISEGINLQNGDCFLICSNEFTKFIDEDEISQILTNNKDSNNISIELIKKCSIKNYNGDISLLIVYINKVEDEDYIVVDKTGPTQLEFIELKKKYNDVVKKQYITNIAAIIFAITTFSLIFTMVYFIKSTRGKELIVVNPNEEVQIMTNTSVKTDDVNKKEDKFEKLTEKVLYKVKEGDTPESISKKFYNTTSKAGYIMEKNNIEDSTKLQIGKELTIYPLEE